METQTLAISSARAVVCAVFATAFSTSVFAEPVEITVAKEYGIGYLPYMIMENNKLVEKHAAALGCARFHADLLEYAESRCKNDQGF